VDLLLVVDLHLGVLLEVRLEEHQLVVAQQPEKHQAFAVSHQLACQQLFQRGCVEAGISDVGSPLEGPSAVGDPSPDCTGAEPFAGGMKFPGGMSDDAHEGSAAWGGP